MISIRNQQDFGGGVMLLAIAGVAGWAVRDLDFGGVSAMGPAFLPLILSLLLAGFGAVLALNGLTVSGPALRFRRLGGILLVVLSLSGFAFLIEDVGLVATAFVMVLVGAFADPEGGWLRNLAFAAGLTVAAALLFGYALSLPIPLWPRF